MREIKPGSAGLAGDPKEARDKVDRERGGLSRRQFLGAVLSVSAGAVATQAGIRDVAAQNAGVSAEGDALAPVDSRPYGLLIDTTECKYCGRCVRACAARHGGDKPGTYYTQLDLTWPAGQDAEPLPVPFHCMHCQDAPCVKVCQGHALQQTAMGAVTYDQSRCVGCLACVNACPFEQTLHYTAPPAAIYKCDLCADRLEAGQLPACVEACEQAYHKALTSGPLDEIVYEGRRRAAEVDGVLLYPGQTHTLVLASKDQLTAATLEQTYRLTPEYSAPARGKAAATWAMRFGWIPFVGGLAYYAARWHTDHLDH